MSQAAKANIPSIGPQEVATPAQLMIQAIHTAVEGRARFKIAGLYRSEPLKRFLEQRVVKANGNGIKAVSANTLTGNALICFDAGLPPEAISAWLAQVLTEFQQSQPCRADAQRTPPPSTAAEPEPTASRQPPAVLAPGYEEQPCQSWHTLETAAVLDVWSTSPTAGLSAAAAAAHKERFGLNAFPETQVRSHWEMFADQFKSLPVALLGGAAGISVLTGGLLDAVLILGVVVANAYLAYKTESAAETTIRSLKNLVKPTAEVIRDGVSQEIAVEDVVPGDLLALKPGTYVAADCRLVAADRLSVDEAALTGESLPVTKDTPPLTDGHVPLADRVNMVYRGTMVTGGQGLGVVVATGPFTELGRLQALVEAAATPVTPLEQQLDRVGNELVLLGCGVCGLVFGVGLARGFAFLQMLHTAVSLAAAAVPEGLPTVATTTLAVGVKKMEQHQVLIRRLEAVETLGCLQTICMDKTGTITRNEMTVVRLFVGMHSFSVDQGDLDEYADIITNGGDHELPWLLKVATLCNETEMQKHQGRQLLAGSATEKALVQLAINYGLDIDHLRKVYPLEGISHRSEQRPFMTTYHRLAAGETLLALKGSPLDVLAMCDWHLQDGRRLPLNVQERLAIEMENDRMAGDSLRVLGFAYALNGAGELENHTVDHNERGFTWLGLTGMADPIRDGVRQMIKDFHRAGIQTIMITGDQSATAYAIGKALNLSEGRPLEILDSSHLESLDQNTIRALAPRVHIFARVSPAHKLEIVQALQSSGRVVGMTGDGINDGPALKAAEVGIAMGESGTDIAREVADVVLKHDNLGDLMIAIQDGRTTYGNIKKAVHFFLSSNVSEIGVTFLALAAGLGSPLNTMQLLWINLVTDIFPGLALTQEPPEPDVLARPPRPVQEPLFSRDEYWRIAQEGATLTAAALGAYGYGIQRYGLGPRASTLAFNTLVISQLLHTLSCRSERHNVFTGTLPANPLLNLAVAGSIALQVVALLVPGLRSLLGMTPITLSDAAVIAGISLLPLLVNEMTKPTQASGPAEATAAADLEES